MDLVLSRPGLSVKAKKNPLRETRKGIENELDGDLLSHQVTLAVPSAQKNSYKLQAPSRSLQIKNVTTLIRDLQLSACGLQLETCSLPLSTPGAAKAKKNPLRH
jgi:hypothetical protein